MNYLLGTAGLKPQSWMCG